MRRLTGALLALLGAPGAGAAQLGGELSLGHDSNVANIRDSAPQFEDGFSLVRFQVDEVLALSASSALLLQAFGQAQNHVEFQGLNQLKAQLLARYLLRPGRGFYVPTLAWSASAAGLAYDSEMRDHSEYRALFYVDQPLTTQLRTRLSVAGRWNRDGEAGVFRDSATQFGVDFDWQVLRPLALYAGYQWRSGDFVASGKPSPAVLAAVPAYAPDDVFEGLTILRQDGHGGIATFGFNYSFSPKTSFDVQVQRAGFESEFGVRYGRTISIASLLFRY
ncbi:MAG: hypothetical protein M3O62_08995 [Pseudomonadota bacterium]|nr:hypothetical protein [Pseudomonadota bacterium]